MKSPVITIDGHKTIMDAAKLMNEHNIGSLLLEYDGKYDIVTERDILKAVAENKLDYKLKATMEDPLITIDEDASLGRAAQLMLTKKIRRLAVVNDTGKIVGIVNVRDIVLSIHEAFLTLFDL